MRRFTVYVYTHRPEGRPPLVLAYTTLSRVGAACVHVIDADRSALAKAQAIEDHRAECLPPRPADREAGG